MATDAETLPDRGEARLQLAEDADAELLGAAVHAGGPGGSAAVLHGDGLDVLESVLALHLTQYISPASEGVVIVGRSWGRMAVAIVTRRGASSDPPPAPAFW